jgi:hypothetical protein
MFTCLLILVMGTLVMVRLVVSSSHSMLARFSLSLPPPLLHVKALYYQYIRLLIILHGLLAH